MLLWLVKRRFNYTTQIAFIISSRPSRSASSITGTMSTSAWNRVSRSILRSLISSVSTHCSLLDDRMSLIRPPEKISDCPPTHLLIVSRLLPIIDRTSLSRSRPTTLTSMLGLDRMFLIGLEGKRKGLRHGKRERTKRKQLIGEMLQHWQEEVGVD